MNHSTIQSVNQSVVQSFYQSAWVSLSIRRLVDDGSVNKSVSLHFSCMFVCPYFCPSFYLSRSVCLSVSHPAFPFYLPSVYTQTTFPVVSFTCVLPSEDSCLTHGDQVLTWGATRQLQSQQTLIQTHYPQRNMGRYRKLQNKIQIFRFYYSYALFTTLITLKVYRNYITKRILPGPRFCLCYKYFFCFFFTLGIEWRRLPCKAGFFS